MSPTHEKQKNENKTYRSVYSARPHRILEYFSNVDDDPIHAKLEWNNNILTVMFVDITVRN